MQKPFLPESLVPKSFILQFGPLIKFALGGWDRLRFHACLRPLFSASWMRNYLCAAKVRLKDFSAHAQALTARVIEEGQRVAAGAGRPYHYLRSSQIRKEVFIEDIVRRDRVREGLIAVLSTVEPCLAISVRGARDRHRLIPVVEQRKCLHLYFYYEHSLFGRCHVRLQTWYPFSVDVCLNGRLWLARQMDAEGLKYRRADNCFLDLEDPARAQALADAQHSSAWLERLNDLLAPVHPLQKEILRPFASLRYYWTLTQSEYATDLVFRDACDLARVYPAFVAHGLGTFQSPHIMRFLGHSVPVTTGRVHPRFRGEVRTDVLERHEGVCLKHRAGLNSQKIYDKLGTVLRSESTVNGPEAFKIYRPAPDPVARPSSKPAESLATPPVRRAQRAPKTKPPRPWRRLRRSVVDIPPRAELSRAANRRYLDALASTHVGTPLGEMAAPLCRPVLRDGKRFRALNPFQPAEAELLRVLSRGEWTMTGVRNRDLQKALYAGRPRDKKTARRRSAAIGRRLRLLRAHGLLRKIPHTHRYMVTESGRAVLTALVAAQRASTEKLTLAMAA
jgi:hypothetical protein